MRTELQISGMTCQRCQRHVEQALREQAGVTQATVDLSRGTATVEHGGECSVAALCAAVVNAGYDCRECNAESSAAS